MAKKTEYSHWKEYKWLKVLDYLEINIIHLHQNIFACTNFCECKGLDILHGFIFTIERDLMWRYWFCILHVICFCKTLPQGQPPCPPPPFPPLSTDDLMGKPGFILNLFYFLWRCCYALSQFSDKQWIHRNSQQTKIINHMWIWWSIFLAM